MTRIADTLGRTFATGEFDDRAKFVATILLDNIRSGDTQIKHRMLLLILSAGVIELLAGSAVAGMNFFGLSLRELTAVQKAAPMVTAYFYFSLCALIVSVKFAQDAYDAMIEACFESLWLEDMELHMRPIYDMRVFALLMSEYKEKHHKVLRLSVSALFALPILLAPAYLIYCYVRLVGRHGALDAMVLASAVVSLLFVVQALLVLSLNTSDNAEVAADHSAASTQ